jgi:hypothetical protein
MVCGQGQGMLSLRYSEAEGESMGWFEAILFEYPQPPAWMDYFEISEIRQSAWELVQIRAEQGETGSEIDAGEVLRKKVLEMTVKLWE